MSVMQLDNMLSFATMKANSLVKEKPTITLKDLLNILQGPVSRLVVLSHYHIITLFVLLYYKLTIFLQTNIVEKDA